MFDPETLMLAETVLQDCRRRGWRLATAESCTGGLVAAALTAIPGSSDVVERGFVTYSNAALRNWRPFQAACLLCLDERFALLDIVVPDHAGALFYRLRAEPFAFEAEIGANLFKHSEMLARGFQIGIGFAFGAAAVGGGLDAA